MLLFHPISRRVSKNGGIPVETLVGAELVSWNRWTASEGTWRNYSGRPKRLDERNFSFVEKRRRRRRQLLTRQKRVGHVRRIFGRIFDPIRGPNNRESLSLSLLLILSCLSRWRCFQFIRNRETSGHWSFVKLISKEFSSYFDSLENYLCESIHFWKISPFNCTPGMLSWGELGD